MIYDPINNDVINSDDKNIPYQNLEHLLSEQSDKSIISTHPHCWTNSVLAYIVKEKIFFIIKRSAKLMMNIPILKKIMSKYYFLAKKI